MERLTKRDKCKLSHGEELVICNHSENDCNDSCMKIIPCKWYTRAIEKLKRYEDLEENGRLVILPCKVRDIIYVVITGCKTVEECKVISVNYSNTATNGNVFYIEALPATGSRALIGFYSNKIGKTVFLTREEAEAKLKELRGGENDRETEICN